MKPDEVVLLAVKARVLAISKRDGNTLWTTKLPGGMTSDFVTVLANKSHVFVHTKGQMHCLSLATGAIQWTNELPGCGYGIASIVFPGGDAAPHPGAVQAIMEAQAAAASSSPGPA
jgi:outer membrane protein assembly factor BamB